MKNIIDIPCNAALTGLIDLKAGIPYATRGEKTLTLELLIPREREVKPGIRYPLVVFIQGSAWTSPDPFWQIPQLCDLARRGFVVASVTHSSCMEGAHAPAFLRDVKASIRFLRANAEEYSIDPERVCAFGTSSGGNTALLLGMTHGLSEFDTEEYQGFTSEVQAVVECFGPTDMIKMATVQYPDALKAEDSLFSHLAGIDKAKQLDILRSISPVEYIREGERFPPFLLVHGDADEVVLCADTEEFYEKLLKSGYDAQMYRVNDAPHEGSFWGPQLLGIIYDFIEAKLKLK